MSHRRTGGYRFAAHRRTSVLPLAGINLRFPMSAQFIVHVTKWPGADLDPASFPGNLPFLRGIDLRLSKPVTFFVGENGSGKSTLLEAMAVLSALPLSGGGTNELGSSHGPEEQCPLARVLRLGFARRPYDGYFFRAELQAHFATLLDERQKDPDFADDPIKNPYRRYGGRSLHRMSHGEAFLSIMQHRFTGGLFLLDEPESALSPQRQLTLLALMHELAQSGDAQFVIATHSAILLTYPDAQIVSFDDETLPTISLTETKHYQITCGILNNPESYWKHLRDDDAV